MSIKKKVLSFAPEPWLKLNYLCHLGDTEIGGYAVSDPENLLRVIEFHTVVQTCSSVFVSFDQDDIQRYHMDQLDAGRQTSQCLSIWCHTHPGSSANPSGTDEDTFANKHEVGGREWAVMFILSRTGETTARLRINVGPGLSQELPVYVDPAAMSKWLVDNHTRLSELYALWDAEYKKHIKPEVIQFTLTPTALVPAWKDFKPGQKFKKREESTAQKDTRELSDYRRVYQEYAFDELDKHLDHVFASELCTECYTPLEISEIKQEMCDDCFHYYYGDYLFEEEDDGHHRDDRLGEGNQRSAGTTSAS